MNKTTRSTYLVLLALLLVSIALFGCNKDKDAAEPPKEPVTESNAGAGNNDTTEPTVDVGQIVFKQAPSLESANLPPVAERLPKEPKVANQIPLHNLEGGKLEIGQYGGILRMVSPDPEWNPDIFLMANEPLLNTPGSTGEEVTPNVLKDFEMSPDGKVFTFTLREGMKWSDGQPVTTEDVRFAVEDFIFNEEINPVFPAWLRGGAKKDSEPMKFEVIDEFTFKMSFSEPYGRFPIQLALTGWRGYTDLLKPAHFLKDYHTKYTDLADLEPLIKEAGFEPGDWVSLFNDRDITNWELTNAQAIGFPNLHPWILVKSSESIKEYERNPYFWKIDAEGNQFPYIDGLRNEFVQDVEMMSTKVLAGEVDLMRESASLNKMPLYREFSEKSGYITPLLDMHVDPTVIWLNQTFDDPIWREVVRDVRFRQALNMGIDRDEIIDAVYYGFGELPKLVPTDYNPDKANELLDAMGMDKRSKDGYRLGPDGKVFEVPFETGAHAPDMIPILELISSMWNDDLGIKTTMKTIDGGLWGTRNSANELQATIMWNVQPMWRGGGWLDFTPDFDGKLWNIWNATEGKEGEVPPDEVKRLFEIAQEVMGVYPSTPEDIKLYDELYQIHHDNVYQMTIAENVKQPIVLNAKLGNVPIGGTAVAANIAGVQMYFKQ